MNQAVITRRALLSGLIAAPAVVPFASLMPLRGIVMRGSIYAAPAPAWFNEYEARRWKRLMDIPLTLERAGRFDLMKTGRYEIQARTVTLPCWKDCGKRGDDLIEAIKAAAEVISDKPLSWKQLCR
jgi:hypothetical protein